jgi:four helix bundle protein
MPEIQSFRDLDAWQAAMDLSIMVYAASRHLPPDERFGLMSQVRRASVSVPSNVAEGQSFGTDGRYMHHLRIALGSIGELSTELEIAVRLNYLPAAEIEDVLRQLVRTRQLLFGLLRSIRRRRVAVAAKTASVVVAFWLLHTALLG